MPVVALELDYNVTKVSRETCAFIRDANNCLAVEKMLVQGSMNEIGVSRRDRWQRSKRSQVSDVRGIQAGKFAQITFAQNVTRLAFANKT